MIDVFTRNEYFEFNGFNFQFNKEFKKVINDYERIINNFDFIKTSGEVEVLVEYADNINSDTYFLNTLYTKKVIIKVNSLRSFYYALTSLDNSIRVINGKKSLLVQKVYDEPDFITRGIIEGFYGTPYTFDMRKDVIEFAFKEKYNSYFYAPKDDLYHREKWRELYPDKEFKQLLELSNHANNNLVDFIYCISPGLDFDYNNEEEYTALFNKIEQVRSKGIKLFALLMDDLPIKKGLEGTIDSPALNHAKVANRLFEYLGSTNLYFCPTDYFQNTDTPYRKDLRSSLNSNIKVFWTGYNTVAEKIDIEECKNLEEYFNREMILWDNYPVNDFEPKRRIYLAPLQNRTKLLKQYHTGYVANPSEHWYLSKMPLRSIARFINDATTYNVDNMVNEMLLIYTNKDSIEYNALKQFIIYNYSSVLSVSEYDIEIKELYSNENFNELDKVYLKMKETYDVLIKFNHEGLLKEMLPYLEYMNNEVTLYNQIKNKNVQSKLLDSMTNSKYKISNDEIIKYVISNNFHEGELTVEKNRDNYWEYQDVHSK